MSYNGVGSYFTFTPHQVYAGYGSYYEIPQPYSGFGAVADTFNPDQVMAWIAESDKCYGPTPVKGYPQGKCNYAGQQANKEIAAALNSLGYGPIAVDGSISWQAAYNRFLADNKLSKGPGFGITRQALLTMKDQLVKGMTPGGTPTEYEKVNGEYVPTGKPGGVAAAGLGMGTWLLAAVAVGAIGYVAYTSGKKKKTGPTTTTTAMTLRR